MEELQTRPFIYLVEPEPTSSPPEAETKPFARIDAFFDALEHIVKRTGKLFGKADYFVFRLAFFFYLLYKMAEYGHYLFSTWQR